MPPPLRGRGMTLQF